MGKTYGLLYQNGAMISDSGNIGVDILKEVSAYAEP